MAYDQGGDDFDKLLAAAMPATPTPPGHVQPPAEEEEEDVQVLAELSAKAEAAEVEDEQAPPVELSPYPSSNMPKTPGTTARHIGQQIARVAGPSAASTPHRLGFASPARVGDANELSWQTHCIQQWAHSNSLHRQLAAHSNSLHRQLAAHLTCQPVN